MAGAWRRCIFSSGSREKVIKRMSHATVIKMDEIAPKSDTKRAPGKRRAGLLK
jgi:hypothetical protein